MLEWKWHFLNTVHQYMCIVIACCPIVDRHERVKMVPTTRVFYYTTQPFTLVQTCTNRFRLSNRFRFNSLILN